MYAPGLGIAPAIVATAVKLLIPAIESLFKSNYTYSFPDAKNIIDNWAGTVNLDPTLNTINAQWAWANVRCMAGDVSAAAEVKAIAGQFQSGQFGPFKMWLTPDGPVPQDFNPTCASAHADATAYATAVIRVLTTRQTQEDTDLYSGTLPAPLPTATVPPDASAAPSSATSDQIGGIPTMYLAAGVVALVLLTRRR